MPKSCESCMMQETCIIFIESWNTLGKHPDAFVEIDEWKRENKIGPIGLSKKISLFLAEMCKFYKEN